MSTEYDVSTLRKMAEIPEDRWPAFFAEMPDLLRHMRTIAELESETDGGVCFKHARWVDDGDVGAATFEVTRWDKH